MDCKRCGRSLTMQEIAATRDRCVTCYHKGVKFILGQKSREIEDLTRQLIAAKQEIDRLSRGMDVVTREWKNSLADIHALSAGLTNKGGVNA